jgi:hypothetical protein
VGPEGFEPPTLRFLVSFNPQSQRTKRKIKS